VKTTKHQKHGAAKTKAVKAKKIASSKAEGAASKEEAPLTAKERQLLGQCEKALRTGIGQFLAVGNALRQINCSRLYRENFPTFELYCQVHWSLGSKYAYRLIQSAECVEGLKKAASAKGYEVLPSNESQVRPLTRLNKPNQQVNAWKRAVKAGEGNVTAEVVEQVVNGMLGQPSKKGSAKSTKKHAEHQLESIGTLVSKELKKFKHLKPNLKKLLNRILELTGVSETSAK